MDSDGSQDATSGNESESESYSRRSRTKKSSSRERSESNDAISSPKSLRSRSQSSSSSSSEDQSDNENSNPQSPVDSQSLDQPKTPQSPRSDEELNESSTAQLTISAPNVASNDQTSANSSRSNSPEPNILENNHKASSSNNFDHSLNNDDSRSVKSGSSKSKQSDKDSESSDESVASHTSRDGRKIANLDDGNTSDSSLSSDDSRDKKKSKPSQPEEISDGDIEMSDHEKEKESEEQPNKNKETTSNLNIVLEDLSDVSDLEDSIDQSDYENSKQSENHLAEEIQSKPDKSKKVIERTSRSEDVEEQLDFEAEDGECAESEICKDKDDKGIEHEAGEIENEVKKPDKVEELEEGELTDEDDVRPEETEPRPVCRFFSRGQCTWGASCRFLHPGVTDKGNYTMFELVRPVVPGDYGSERMVYSGRIDPPPMESAWERGLRTAKEMMRKSIKRKEQDIDFEEKKMNLSLAQEEFDKENGYYAKAPSPEPSRYVTVRHTPIEYPVRVPPEEPYYSRRQVIYEPEYAPLPRERVRTYREVQPHRTTEYYSTKHEEDASSLHSKAKRPKREVIVQRVEERSSRGDEWSDPWMRLKSPAGRKGGRRRSYSSGSSYSSSSSSASSKSSYRSRSRSSHHKRSPRSHRRQVSPSVIVSERKAANERAALMNPPAPRKKAPSPSMMRLGAQNPPAPSKVDQFGRTRSKLAVAAALARVKGRARSSRSSSASSSGSSSSDSDSSASSSSSSRNRSPSPRRPSGVDLAIALKAKAMDALKSGSEKRQIKLNLKNTVITKKADFAEVARKPDIAPNRKRLASSPPASDPKNIINKKASSRREELLKQLKAVEDAIAKKRSKVN